MILNGHTGVLRDVCDCTILVKSSISIIDGNGACEFDSGDVIFFDKGLIDSTESVHPESRRALVSKTRELSLLVSRMTLISSLVPPIP